MSLEHPFRLATIIILLGIITFASIFGLRFFIQYHAPSEFSYNVHEFSVEDVNISEKDYVITFINRTSRYNFKSDAIRDWVWIRPKDNRSVIRGTNSDTAFSVDTITNANSFKTQLPQNYNTWEAGEYKILVTFFAEFPTGVKRSFTIESELFNVTR